MTNLPENLIRKQALSDVEHRKKSNEAAEVILIFYLNAKLSILVNKKLQWQTLAENFIRKQACQTVNTDTGVLFVFDKYNDYLVAIFFILH